MIANLSRRATLAVLGLFFGAIVSVALALTSTGPASAAEDVILIGTPLALTGALADEGRKQQIAYKMWLDRVNAQGGIQVGDKKMKVKFIEYDYQTNGKRAQQLIEKLITDDKVDFLTAPFGSGHTKIAAAVAERYGVPMMASVASSESVFNQGFKNLFGTLAPNQGFTDTMFGHFGKVFPNTKTIAILGRNDVFPKSMAKAFSRDAAKFGIKVVYDELYAVGTLDHSSSLSRIKSLKPDWIYVTGYTADLVLVRKQMDDLGVYAPIVTMITGPAYKEFVDGLGVLAEGISSASWWHHATTYKSNDVFGSTKVFYEAFLKQEGYDPDYVHASSAASLVALQEAIERAGSKDRDKVRAELAKLDMVTFYGQIKFGPNGMNTVRELPVIQIQDGKPVILSPENLKQAETIVMPKG